LCLFRIYLGIFVLLKKKGVFFVNLKILAIF
jgi:hypothetical protein